MILYEKIISIYSELTQEDFRDTPVQSALIRLRNDGDGDYIEEWNHPTLTQPTQEQLDGVTE